MTLIFYIKDRFIAECHVQIKVWLRTVSWSFAVYVPTLFL